MNPRTIFGCISYISSLSALVERWSCAETAIVCAYKYSFLSAVLRRLLDVHARNQQDTRDCFSVLLTCRHSHRKSRSSARKRARTYLRHNRNPCATPIAPKPARLATAPATARAAAAATGAGRPTLVTRPPPLPNSTRDRRALCSATNKLR